MARMKPLDVKAYQRNQTRVAQLLDIAEGSPEPVKAFNALMVNHINSDLPTARSFRRQAVKGEFPRPFKAWNAIERLMIHHGLDVLFDKSSEAIWLHRQHHPLHAKNGFPFRRDLKLTMEMINWINTHPCIIKPVNQTALLKLIQAPDSPIIRAGDS